MTKRRIVMNPPAEGDFLLPVDSASAAKAFFARKLQDLLTQKDWTQADLARRVSEFRPGKGPLDRSSVSKYLSGAAYPSRATLETLAGVFGISVEELIAPKGLVQAGMTREIQSWETLDRDKVSIRIQKVVPKSVALAVWKLLDEVKE